MDSIISHVSIGTNQFDHAITFYDQVMATLGYSRIMELPGAIAYGKKFPEFWVQLPHDNQPASVGNGTHIAFLASSREEVHAFHAAALAAGGMDDGAPGPRPDYDDAYYACYVRDLDGHKVEAMVWEGN